MAGGSPGEAPSPLVGADGAGGTYGTDSVNGAEQCADMMLR